MEKVKTFFLPMIVMLLSFNLSAQELKVDNSSAVNINQLPEYIVITTENTDILGGIDIQIDSKKSKYKDQLKELNTLLQNGKKLQIRNQTDLLSAMSQLGYEYVDAFNSESLSDSGDIGGVDTSVGLVKFRVNIVFRKKAKYRE